MDSVRRFHNPGKLPGTLGLRRGLPTRNDSLKYQDWNSTGSLGIALEGLNTYVLKAIAGSWLLFPASAWTDATYPFHGRTYLLLLTRTAAPGSFPRNLGMRTV